MNGEKNLSKVVINWEMGLNEKHFQTLINKANSLPDAQMGQVE